MAINSHMTFTQRLLGKWVLLIQRHSPMVIVLSLLLTIGTLYYSVKNFKINTDMHSMISQKLPFQKLEKDFSKAFPQQNDTIVIVIDADTPEQAQSARKLMAERLREERAAYGFVYEPGAGEFFERNGLLYLTREELEELADQLSAAQPFLAFLSKDPSLRGLFTVIEAALDQKEPQEGQGSKVVLLLDRMSEAFENAVKGRPYQMSWESLVFGGKETSGQRRQFIIVQPRKDESSLAASEGPLAMIRRIAGDLGFNNPGGVKMHITGDFALAHENLAAVRDSTGVATVASLVLVAVILFVGLYASGRLIFSSLVTLVMGLIWSTAFALATVGSLNMISITFGVLFIGLGIDYSIQFCLRYRELIEEGRLQQEGITATATSVGRSLLFSAITTALGFYSFLPTAYAGVAELGFISGTSMFISFFSNITVLPALLTLFPVARGKGWSISWQWPVTLPYRYPRAITIIAASAGLASAFFLPRVFFDYNPLNLYNRASESVVTMKELFKDPEAHPWSASVLVSSESEARRLAEQLRGLKEVKTAITVADFVPEHQEDKLGLIADIALFMPPQMSDLRVKPLGYGQGSEALANLEEILKRHLNEASQEYKPSVQRLFNSVVNFRALLAGGDGGPDAFAAMEKGLVSALPALFDRLKMLLRPSPVYASSALPQELRNQYVSADGRYRVQIFPREDLTNLTALERFIHAVRSVTPNATDTPFTVYESGKAVAGSFREATLYALVVIILFLLAGLRSVSRALLILIPLVLAFLLTSAASVLLAIPVNFANVIVVPLILGIGVHSGVIFIVRDWKNARQDDNLLRSSMARATLFSNLATLISTGSLAFSPHHGIASIGILLTLCLAFLIFSTLLFLPALISLTKVRITFSNRSEA